MVHLIKWAANENQARKNARETVLKLNFQSSYRRANRFDVTCSFHQSSFSYERGIFKVQRQSPHLSFVSSSWINGHQKHSSCTMQRRQCKWIWKADGEWRGCGLDCQFSGKMARLGSAAILPEVFQPEQLHCDHTLYTFRDSRLI